MEEEEEEEADLDAALVHFEFGIRELVMNNASALGASGRPAGDRIRAGQTEVPGERAGPPALNAKRR